MAVTQVDRIVRVTWVFSLKQGAADVEVAEPGVTYRAGAIPSDPDDLSATLKDMATAAYASVVANLTTGYYSESVVLAKVRVALEGTNGHTLAEEFAVFGGALMWVGTGDDDCLPWMNSLAVSLYAYEPGNFDALGKSKRGRFYGPPPNTSVIATDGSGFVTLDYSGDTGDEWGFILQELQEHDYSLFPAFAPVLVVNSRQQSLVPGFTGAAYPVRYIRIDNKMDTQRRRTNREAASVFSRPWPNP